jgi:2-iminobutanoate/2-iminopropanoate deaminase
MLDAALTWQFACHLSSTVASACAELSLLADAAAKAVKLAKRGRKIMTSTIHDIGIASQIGRYSDAVEVRGNVRWLFTSGTPGLSVDGTLPSDITGQAELAWRHVVIMLERAGMTVNDLVKVSHYLLRAADIPAYAKVRSRFLGDARPASMLMVIPQLVKPEFLLEIEAYAAKGS